MITGAHAIIYSTHPEADRAFLRDVLRLRHVDAGDGWLIFGLPPSEVAVHPSEKNNMHEFYLLCDDVQSFITQMSDRDIVCDEAVHQPWGVLTRLTLPGGGQLGVYQPRHARPIDGASKTRSRKPVLRPTTGKRRTSKRKSVVRKRRRK